MCGCLLMDYTHGGYVQGCAYQGTYNGQRRLTEAPGTSAIMHCSGYRQDTMDTVSHALLGAALGQRILGRRVGNAALLTGAAIALLPDIDVAIGHWLGDAEALTFHRGLTHSVLFTILLSAAIGPLLSRLNRDKAADWKHWSLLCLAVLSSHLILDACTSYGIQLLQPFSDQSFALASISVIDPLFTLPLLISMAVVPWLSRQHRHRNRLALMGMLLSTTYLGLTLYNKHLVEDQFRQGLSLAGIEYQRLFVKPTMFNNLLWRGIAETAEGYQVGFFSRRDKVPPTTYRYFPRNGFLLDTHHDSSLVQDLLRVTDGYYQVIQEDGELLFRDLRYGQAFEWLEDDRPHVFTYRLHTESGRITGLETLNLRVDKERDRETFAALVTRALGSRL